MNNQGTQLEIGKGFKTLYIISLAALIFSGFGQMPIFNRYYLTSIPGLKWTGEFHITLIIHYLAAALFLGLTLYYIILKAARKKLWPPRSGPAWAKIIIFLVLIFSGIVLAARNISGVVLPPGLLVVASLVHVAGTMGFLLLAATWFRFAGPKAKAAE
jgi:phosphoglycerol transferase MdoB-like AlkP superfamily enzyme